MKRITLVLVIVIVSLLSVGLVAAQGPGGSGHDGRGGPGGRGDRGGHFVDIIAEALEVEPEVLFEAMQEDGATWASVIEANGGDVDAIQALIVADIVEKTGADPADVEAQVSEKLNSTLAERGDRDGGRGGHFVDIIAEALEVEPEVLFEAMQEDGATWASVIEANGGDVDAIQALIVADIVEKTGADPADVEAQVSERLNSTLVERVGRGGPGGRPGRGPRGEGSGNPAPEGTDAPAGEDA